jgi:sarcosine oxidase, subunit gamma
MADRRLHIAPVGERVVLQLKSSASDPPPPLLMPSDLAADVRVLTLGPTEWLAVCDRIDATRLRERLDHHFAGQGITGVELSCGIKALRVDGAAARELLSKGCGLNLDPDSFPAGKSTRTRFAQLAVVMDCVDPSPRFELYVGRSYLAWLTAWLEDAAVEFQAAE